MIFGMLPMALGVDPGGGQRSRSASWWSAGCWAPRSSPLWSSRSSIRVSPH